MVKLSEIGEDTARFLALLFILVAVIAGIATLASAKDVFTRTLSDQEVVKTLGMGVLFLLLYLIAKAKAKNVFT